MENIHEFDPFHVEDMGKEEYSAKQDYVTSKCLCATCPTYVKSDEFLLSYGGYKQGD